MKRFLTALGLTVAIFATALGLFVTVASAAPSVFTVPQGGTGWGNLNTGYVLFGNGTGKVSTSTNLFENTIGNLLFTFGSSTALTVTSLYSTTASTTNLTINLPSCSGGSALTTNSSGVVGCGAITAAASFPFLVTTNYGATANSTSTPIWFTAGLQASSTSYLANTKTDNATTTWLGLPSILSKILYTDANGTVFGTSTLSVNNGGTGAQTLTAGDILVGNGTGAIQSTSTLAVNKGGTGAATLTGFHYGAGTAATVGSSTVATNVGGTGQNTNTWSALPLVTAGVWSQYGGSNPCTNQVALSISAVGVISCTSVTNAMLSNSTISGVALGSSLATLTATNGTLTFSGNYDGSAARTVGLNLGNANTWTALQQFSNASSTVLTGLTAFLGNAATSTFNLNGTIGLASTTPSPLWGISVGTTTQFGGTQVAQFPATTTSAASYTVNWQTGNYQQFTLNQAANFVINATSSNPLDGGKYILRICEDGTGGFGATFVTPGQLRWAIGTTSISTTANTCSFIGMIYDAKKSFYQVIASSTNILAN